MYNILICVCSKGSSINHINTKINKLQFKGTSIIYYKLILILYLNTVEEYEVS